MQDDPYQPTDITSIYPKGVPSIALFTGTHKDYHKPTDDPDTLNYEGMERVAEYATLNANYLMRRLEAKGFELAFPARRAGHEFFGTL